MATDTFSKKIIVHMKIQFSSSPSYSLSVWLMQEFCVRKIWMPY